jgi:cobalamin biosynthesis Mg chelatase CobN
MTKARSTSRNAPAWVTAILVVLGVLLLVVAVVYFG